MNHIGRQNYELCVDSCTYLMTPDTKHGGKKKKDLLDIR